MYTYTFEPCLRRKPFIHSFINTTPFRSANLNLWFKHCIRRYIKVDEAVERFLIELENEIIYLRF